MMRYVIGIDNGSTGTIAVFKDDKLIEFIETPSITVQNYTKKIKSISRIDFPRLLDFLSEFKENAFAVVERPIDDPIRHDQTISSQRAFEATSIALETLGVAFIVIDSRRWQHRYLKGFSGPALKTESARLGIDIFPKFKKEIIKHGDADGIFIAKSVVDGFILFGERQRVEKPKPKIKKFKSNV